MFVPVCLWVCMYVCICIAARSWVAAALEARSGARVPIVFQDRPTANGFSPQCTWLNRRRLGAWYTRMYQAGQGNKR